MKFAESSPYRLETLLEKEKLLFTGNFSFSQCFQRFVLQTHKDLGLLVKGLKVPKMLGFELWLKTLWEKE